MLKVLHEAALTSSQSQTDLPHLSGDKDRLTLLLSQVPYTPPFHPHLHLSLFLDR